MNVKCDIKYLEHYDMEKWGPIKYAHEGDAGFDLHYAANFDEYLLIPGFIRRFQEEYDTESNCRSNPDIFRSGDYNNENIAIIPTGIAMSISNGYQLEIRPRSGLAAKYGISVVNSPGTIDSGYRNEIKVILINHGYNDFYIEPGDRIAQAVLMPYFKCEFNRVDNLDETTRNLNGFGSTGVK